MGAKRTKFSKEIIEEIAGRIGKGMTEKAACALSARSPESFSVTVSRNPEYRKILDIAQAKAQELAIDAIIKRTPGWQACAWLLERRHGADFRKAPAVVTQTVTTTIGQSLGFTDEEFEEFQALAQQRLNRDPASEKADSHEKSKSTV